MKINVYPADPGGCGHYRVIWPARALADQGADIEIITADEPAERQVQATWWTDDTGTSRLVGVTAPEADVVVLQRPLTDTLAQSIPMLQAQGVKVVVEIDDDFETIHPRNTSWRTVHPKHSPRRNWAHLAEACRAADWVVVSTPALAARYGAHGRVSVVPNLIPRHYLDIEAEPHEETYVGWSGSVETHPDDLQQCGPAIAQVLRSTGAEFAVVGTGKGVRAALGLTEAPLAAGWQSLERYPVALAQIDVGIVPLQRSAFNEAKSWLKGLEMASLGVPFVASPTGPYRTLVELGVGQLAERPKDWQRAVRRLVLDADHRAEQAARGCEVAARMTIEEHCERWWDAWSAPLINSPRALCRT